MDGTTRFAAATTVTVSVSGSGTASAVDFAAVSDFDIEIAAGAASDTGTFTLTPTNDAVDETDETITVSGVSGSLTVNSATINLTDDDGTPTSLTLTVNDNSVGEDEGATTITVTATLNGTTQFAEAKTVEVSVAGSGTATAVDFAAVSPFDIEIAAGAASGNETFTLTPTDDAVDETDETITVSGVSTGLMVNSATISLTDDDPEPSLSIDSPSVTEGNSGSATLTFEVTLDTASGKQVTVQYADAGTGTATSGTDYTAITGGTLTFAAGTTSQTFNVSVTGDVLDESNETVVVTLSNAGNATIGTATGSGTITDDDDAPTSITLTVSDNRVREDDGATTITVTATVDGTTRFAEAKTVRVSVSGSGTTTAVDFAAVADFDIVIAAGEASGTGTFTLTPNADAVDETDEAITVSGTSSGLTVSSDTITLTDDKGTADPVALTADAGDDQRVDEGDGVTLDGGRSSVLSGPRGLELSYAWTQTAGRPAVTLTGAGTATPTFTAPQVSTNTALTFELTVTAGGASASDTVIITVLEDLFPEFTETVPDQLYWVGTAIDALELPAATGGNGTLTYTLSPALPEGLRFAPETRIVSGTPSGDLAKTTYTLTATDSDGDEAALSFAVTVLEDLFPEFTETVPDQLYWVGAAIDALALPAATGGNGTLAYTLSPALPEGLRFAPETRIVSGTPSGDLAKTTYTLTATDSDGDEAALSFPVTVLEDLFPEFTETVPDQLYRVGAAIDALELPAATGGNGTLTYTLSPALPEGLHFAPETRIVSGTSSGDLAKTTYTLTATDMDGDEASLLFTVEVWTPITLTMADAEAMEGEEVTFVLELSPPSPRPMRVAYTTAPVTATEGRDYEHAAEHRFSIAAGVGSLRVAIPTMDDEEVEPDETFTLSIVPEWTVVKGVEAMGTIIDDDASARSRALEVVLASFGRTVASETVDVVEDRFTGASSSSGTHVTLGGRRLSLGAVGGGGATVMGGGSAGGNAFAVEFGTLQGAGRGSGVFGGEGSPPDGGAVAWEDLTTGEVVSGSGFAVRFGEVEEAGSGGTGDWTVWGRTGRSEFSGRPESGLSVDGDVSSGYVGWDTRLRSDLLAGVALSYHEGEMSYELEGERGQVDATLTGVLPYGRWAPGGGLSVWGLAGMGWGDAKLVDEVGATRTGIEMRMLALGWRKELGEVEGLEWALKGDGFAVEMESDEAWKLPGTKSRVQRLRMAVESAKEWSLGEHGRLRSELELGGRWDGGRVEKGYGAELSGGVEYADSRLGVEVEARGRYLLAHQSDDFEERGASVALRFDPGGDGKGVWLGMAPRWGASGSGVESLWGNVLDGGGESASGRWAVEGGYRLVEPFDLGVTAGVEMGEGESYPFGVKLQGRISW